MTEYSNSDIERVINEYIHNKMYRDILRERLIDGDTYSEISIRHDRSERWVWTLVSRYKNKIFTKWLDELKNT